MTEERLKQIEEMGTLQFLPAQVGIALDLTDQETADITNIKTPIGRAYQRGSLLAEAEVRRSILQQAKNGSTPAQKEMLGLIKRARQTV